MDIWIGGFLVFFFYNVRMMVGILLFLNTYDFIILEIIMVNLLQLLQKNISQDEKKTVKRQFSALFIFVVFMALVNVAFILCMRILDKIGRIKEEDHTTVEDVLIRLNVISFVSMIGVTLTLGFTIYFFRKIRRAFIRKCTNEIVLAGQQETFSKQQNEFNKLNFCFKCWTIIIVVCFVIITIRFIVAIIQLKRMKQMPD